MTVGYLIANISVTDPRRFEEYRARVTGVIAQYGGRYLIRGGAIEKIEGELGFDRCVVLEFPSVQDARKFYDSPEYAPLLKLRRETTVSHVVIAEGFSGA
jgi:uncharacterized protein (DUF1330 family)